MNIYFITTLGFLTGCGQIGLEPLTVSASISRGETVEDTMDIEWLVGHADSAGIIDVDGHDASGAVASFQLHADDPTVSRAMTVEMIYPKRGIMTFDEHGKVVRDTLPPNATALLKDLVDFTVEESPWNPESEITAPVCDLLTVQAVSTCAVSSINSSACEGARQAVEDRCASLPDLVVTSWFQGTDPLAINLRVANVGDKAASSFGVGLWADAPFLLGCGSESDTWIEVNEDLAPGDETTVYIPLPEMEPGRTTMHVFLDPDCEVTENSFGGEDNEWPILVDVPRETRECAEDDWEPNDAFAITGPDAAPLAGRGTHQGLAVCADDLDWFRTLNAQRVEIAFEHDRGDLNLAIFNPQTGAIIDHSNGTGDSEMLVLPNQEVLVLVYGQDGDLGPYTLCVDTEDCPAP